MNYTYTQTKPLLASLLILFITACTSAQDSGDNSPAAGVGNVKLTSLVAGESTSVSVGDKIEPLDDNTEIEILHVLDDDSKIVKVVNGKVNLTSIVTE